jgi:hypothetical protein
MAATIDFTNKAFEAVGQLGKDGERDPADARAPDDCGCARRSSASGGTPTTTPRSRRTVGALDGASPPGVGAGAFSDVGALGWALLDDDPRRCDRALLDAIRNGADEASRPRCAYGKLRIVRFHVQVTTAIGTPCTRVHGCERIASGVQRARPTCCGAVHAAAAHQPRPVPQRARRGYRRRPAETLAALAQCFGVQGIVGKDRQQGLRFLRSGAAPGSRPHSATRCSSRSAGVHWYQTVGGCAPGAAVAGRIREEALVLVGVARFLAAARRRGASCHGRSHRHRLRRRSTLRGRGTRSGA